MKGDARAPYEAPIVIEDQRISRRALTWLNRHRGRALHDVVAELLAVLIILKRAEARRAKAGNK
jgi:hypothetical protein